MHNNPVRAKIAENADTYRWSSHQAYLGKSNPLGLVDTDHVLRMFSEGKSRALRHYVAFMREAAALKRGGVYATIDQRLQGDQEFVDQVQQRIDGEIKKERRKKEHSLPAICRVVEERHGITRDRLRSSGKERQVMIARRVFTQTAKLYGYRGKEIAAYLRKDPASVTGYLREEDHGREVVKVTKRLDEAGKNVNTEV